MDNPQIRIIVPVYLTIRNSATRFRTDPLYDKKCNASDMQMP